MSAGIEAHATIKPNRADSPARRSVEHTADLGYALLLKRVMRIRVGSSRDQGAAAGARSRASGAVLDIPRYGGLGIYFIALFAVSFCHASLRELARSPLRMTLWSLPLPWLAIELGWIVAEYGRQPWAIEGVLPTALGVSSVTVAQVATSLIGFVLFYSALAIVDAILMLRYARRGPDGLGMWPDASAESSPARLARAAH